MTTRATVYCGSCGAVRGRWRPGAGRRWCCCRRSAAGGDMIHNLKVDGNGESPPDAWLSATHPKRMARARTSPVDASCRSSTLIGSTRLGEPPGGIGSSCPGPGRAVRARSPTTRPATFELLDAVAAAGPMPCDGGGSSPCVAFRGCADSARRSRRWWSARCRVAPRGMPAPGRGTWLGTVGRFHSAAWPVAAWPVATAMVSTMSARARRSSSRDTPACRIDTTCAGYASTD